MVGLFFTYRGHLPHVGSPRNNSYFIPFGSSSCHIPSFVYRLQLYRFTQTPCARVRQRSRTHGEGGVAQRVTAETRSRRSRHFTIHVHDSRSTACFLVVFLVFVVHDELARLSLFILWSPISVSPMLGSVYINTADSSSGLVFSSFSVPSLRLVPFLVLFPPAPAVLFFLSSYCSCVLVCINNNLILQLFLALA